MRNLKQRLAKDAAVWHRLWTVRLAVFWMAFNGAFASLDFFASTSVVSDHPFAFMFINISGNVIIGLARIMKQPGL